MEHVEYAYTRGMDDAEIEERLRTTETACYVLYGTEPTDDPRELESWSIVVTGQLVDLPETEHGRFDTAEINRRFSPIRVFDEAIEDIDITIAELDIDTVTGRRTLGNADLPG